MPELTPQQREAVENRGGSLLVSAAAGSGKTKVLVDRLFRYVTEEYKNLDEFLIITYTKAAAAELRGKIAGELSRRMADNPADEHLRAQYLRVWQADIRTVDSFCTMLLRENPHLLAQEGERYSLTADFRVLDESEAQILREQVLRRTLEEFYENLTPGRELLADTLGAGQDDSRLASLVLEVYGKLQSHAWPLQWLEESRKTWHAFSVNPDSASDTAQYAKPSDTAQHAKSSDAVQHAKSFDTAPYVKSFDETPYAKALLAMTARTASHWSALLRRHALRVQDDPALYKGYGIRFLAAADSLEPLCNAFSWDSAAQSVKNFEFPRLSTPRGRKDEPLVRSLRQIWTAYKTACGKLQALFALSADDAMSDLRGMAPAMDALLEFTGIFARAYQTEKSRRNCADFSDQEHLALKLLVRPDGTPTELGKQISGRYVEILVDEYQDTNEVQNAIFQSVSRQGKNLFTVGDVKQSIYRFRLAEPSIFLEKYAQYLSAGEADAGQPRKIVLTKNFRSRREILDAANYIFSAILSPEMGEMAYGEEEALHLGALYYPEHTGCDVEFHLIDARRGRRSGNASDNTQDETSTDNPQGGTTSGTTTADNPQVGTTSGTTATDNPQDKAAADSVQTAAKPVKRAEAEARFAALRIRQLLDSGFPVTDTHSPNGPAMRPCRPEDIVILMRSPHSRIALWADALTQQNIPCSFDEDSGFFRTMEVSTVIALLEIIDNPRQDVPLISVLRSPVFAFSPDHLAEIRSKSPKGDFYDAVRTAAGVRDDSPENDSNGNTSPENNNPDNSGVDNGGVDNGKPDSVSIVSAGSVKSEPITEPDQDCTAFLATLETLRQAAPDMSVYRLLWHIYNTLNLPGLFGAMDSGAERRENLMSLSRYAEQFEQNGYRGLFAFLTQLNRLTAAGRAPEGHSGSAAGVRLMSIHKSKGLEFPIVLLADLDHAFSRQDFNAAVLVHPQMGLGPEFVDLERRIRYPTLARTALETQLRRENLSEEQRILYVGMTRPQEKLILIDSVYGAAKHLEKLSALSEYPLLPETVAGAGSFGDWLLLALLARPEAASLREYAGTEVDTPYSGTDAPWKVFVHQAESFRDMTADTADGISTVDKAGTADGIGTVDKAGTADGSEPENVSDDGKGTDNSTNHEKTAFDAALLEWKYPHAKASLMPAKVTATQLKGRVLDDEIAENTIRSLTPRPLSQPKFLWKSHALTPAEQGTAVHLFLQYLRFDGPDPAIQSAEFVSRRLLTPEQAAAVNLNLIRRFLASPVADEIRNAPRVWREYPFTLLLNASELDPDADSQTVSALYSPADSQTVSALYSPADSQTASALYSPADSQAASALYPPADSQAASALYPPADSQAASALYPDADSTDQVLLQGVVDCCYETPAGLVIVDFKTDHIRRGEQVRERAKRYYAQLDAYSHALERVLERNVIRRVLYFLTPGESVEI